MPGRAANPSFRSGSRLFKRLFTKFKTRLARDRNRRSTIATFAGRPPFAFKCLLVAVDSSAQSEKAFLIGMSIAAAYGAKLEIISVLDSADAGITDDPPLHDGGAFQAQARLVALARSHGLKVASRILTSSPDTPAAILAEAGKIKADLVIMGHRGNSGAEDLGPVVKEVSRRAPCSVLIAR